MAPMLCSPADVRPHTKILDARFRLDDPLAGRRLFAQGHIPGAQFVDLETELSGEKTGKNGRHPVPSRQDLKQLFGRLGIGEETEVVAYDDADHAGASRLWVLLRWMGHEKVCVLDGGLAAWKEAGLPLETGPRLESWPEEFPDRPPLAKLLPRDHLPGKFLVDARAPERYRGEVEPIDAKAGHIPGAENLFYKSLLAENGKFRSKPELERLLPRQEAVFYCGSGVTAAVLLFASELIGRRAALYPGSWSEWSSDLDAPVETGSYRRGVVAVVNREGKVLMFERADHPGSWQFPQGGVEAGETDEEALHREMDEEAGMKVRVAQKATQTTTYDWPKPDERNKHRGQRHVWFLCELLSGPDLGAGDGSFSSYEWVEPATALRRVVGWKRRATESGLAGLGLL